MNHFAVFSLTLSWLMMLNETSCSWYESTRTISPFWNSRKTSTASVVFPRPIKFSMIDANDQNALQYRLSEILLSQEFLRSASVSK